MNNKCTGPYSSAYDCPIHSPQKDKVMDNSVGKARKYDSTVARIAGNILSGSLEQWEQKHFSAMAQNAVALARMIVAEVERTEPKTDKNGYVKD